MRSKVIVVAVGKVSSWWILVASLLLSPGCSKCGTGTVGSRTCGGAESPAPPTPKHWRKQVASNTRFGLSLYKALRKKSPDRNLLFAPYTVSTALAMTYAVANGTTKEEIARALAFNLPEKEIHRSFRYLSHNVTGTAELTIKSDCGMWMQPQRAVKPALQNLLEVYYGTSLQLVDFASNPENSIRSINEWIADRTKGRIRQIASKASVTTQTRAVLVAASYFEGTWLYPFSKSTTRPAPFTKLDRSRTDVPMMMRAAQLKYSKKMAYDVVSLPYLGKSHTMIVVVPKITEFSGLENSLTPKNLHDIVSELRPGKVRVWLPKFDFARTIELSEPLGLLGIRQAFTEDADFSNIDETRQIRLGKVLHASDITVDERGTIASSAAAVVMEEKSIDLDIIDIEVNRPFLFFVMHEATGTVLFAGCVLNPLQ